MRSAQRQEGALAARSSSGPPAGSADRSGRAAAILRLPERFPLLIGFAAFAVVAAATRLSSLREPVDRDTGTYLYIGQSILHGETPYSDEADNKGPVTYLLFALIRLVAGDHVTVVRGLLVLCAALTALAAAAYVARRSGPGAGLLAGMTFALLSAIPAWEGVNPNTEQFGVLPMTGAVWLASRGSVRSAAGAGALVATATLMNLGFVVVAPIVLAELLLSGRTQRGTRTVAAIGGGVAVVLPVLLWLALEGALDDAREQVLGQAFTAVEGRDPAETQNRVDLDRLFSVPAGGLVALGAVAAAVAAVANRRLRLGALVAGAWVVVMWLRVKVNSYEFAHHYFPILPGVAMATALGAAAVWRDGPRLRVMTATLLLALPAWTYVIGPEWRAQRGASDTQELALAYPVAEVVKRHTRPDDRIFVAGSDPQVYWLADRQSVTRHPTEYPLQLRPEYAGEILRDLKRDPPAAIAGLFGEPDEQGGVVGVSEFIEREGYRKKFERDGARVFVRADRSVPLSGR